MELFLWWCAAFLALACAVSMLRTRMLEHFPRGPTLCNRGPATTVGAAGGERRQDAGAVSASAGTSRGAAGTPSPAAAPAVLLLIAHPDDEAMFFVPTILAIAKVSAVLAPTPVKACNGDVVARRWPGWKAAKLLLSLSGAYAVHDEHFQR